MPFYPAQTVNSMTTDAVPSAKQELGPGMTTGLGKVEAA